MSRRHLMVIAGCSALLGLLNVGQTLVAADGAPRTRTLAGEAKRLTQVNADLRTRRDALARRLNALKTTVQPKHRLVRSELGYLRADERWLEPVEETKPSRGR